MNSEKSNLTLQTPEDNPLQESPKVNVENILAGNGMEEIERVGWLAYREALETVSYADIIDRQIKQIEEIQSAVNPALRPAPEWIMKEKNSEAGERAGKLSLELSETYPKNGPSPFFSYQDRGKKLMVQGRKEMMDEKDTPIENRVTRIYFTVASMNAPEAFKALFKQLAASGVMNDIQLALNLENYQAESLDVTFENNTIVAYVYGKDPKLMERVIKAVSLTKKLSDPELWRLSPSDLAKAKESQTKDFMIPLDDTTAFVEGRNIQSYHAGPRGRMFYELTGDLPSQKTSLQDLSGHLRKWTPKRSGLFDEDVERRRYMPALVFEKAA